LPSKEKLHETTSRRNKKYAIMHGSVSHLCFTLTTHCRWNNMVHFLGHVSPSPHNTSYFSVICYGIIDCNFMVQFDQLMAKVIHFEYK